MTCSVCARPRCTDPECREALRDAEVPYRLEVEPPPRLRCESDWGHAERVRRWRRSRVVLPYLRRGLSCRRAAELGGASLSAAARYARQIREEARP